MDLKIVSGSPIKLSKDMDQKVSQRKMRQIVEYSASMLNTVNIK